ncbi:MAG: helix-turn-helix domain-containing protein [Bifidobacteriaceae bacterium]|nr:helix-turn-helix domain-containing protein [Bifidobacteriaceae bacterium]
MEERPSEFVQSLERGLSVIKAFDGDHPELTLSEVAARTGLTRAAARRFLITLESIGYVRSHDRRFSLRPAVLELAHSYLSSMDLPEIAMPHLESLAAQVQAASSVSVLDRRDIVYVARVATKRIMSVNINVGTRFRAAATSMGRAILAFLPEAELDKQLENLTLEKSTPYTITGLGALREELDRVRDQGWCLLDQELEVGLRALAAPIRDASGYPVAAINVSVPLLAQSVEEIQANFLEPVLRRAGAIEQDLRATGFTR